MKAADSMIMGHRHCIAVWLFKMQAQKSLKLCWRSFLGGSSDIVTRIFSYKGGQYDDYGRLPLHSTWTVEDAWRKMVDAPLTLIFMRR